LRSRARARTVVAKAARDDDNFSSAPCQSKGEIAQHLPGGGMVGIEESIVKNDLHEAQNVA
jgi:hypothetical protein